MEIASSACNIGMVACARPRTLAFLRKFGGYSEKRNILLKQL
jgi:hypothetical protein